MASFRKKGPYWYYRVSYKDEAKNKTKEKGGFRTKKEAQLAAAKLEADLNDGFKIKSNNELFIDYYQRWFDIYKKDKLSLETNRNYRYAIKVSKQYFGAIKMVSLDRESYQIILNNYASTHSFASVKKLNSMYKACFNDAVHNGDIKRSPAYKVTLSGTAPKKEEDKYLDEYEAKQLVKVILDGICPNYISRYMILLALASGARYAEVIGLTEDCVDFENNTIKINKTWNYRDLKDFSTTKNEASMRTLKIDNFTMTQLYNLIMSKKQPHPKGLIFANTTGYPITDNAVNKALKKALKRAEITSDITFHSLRHTHGSLLLLHETSLIYVSKRLGHASIETTANIYSHLVKELNEKGNQITEDLMNNIYK